MGILTLPPTEERAKTLHSNIYFIKQTPEPDIYIINSMFRRYLLVTMVYGGLALAGFILHRYYDLSMFFSNNLSQKEAYYMYTFYLNWFGLISVWMFCYYYLLYTKNVKINQHNLLRIFSENQKKALENSLFHKVGWVFGMMVLMIIVVYPSFILTAIYRSVIFENQFQQYNDLTEFVIFTYVIWCVLYSVSSTALLAIIIGFKCYYFEGKDEGK